MADEPRPYSYADRLITPGVLIAALIVLGLVAGGTVAGVTYLSAQGLDPDPMVRLVVTVVGAAGGLGTFVMQLVDRAQKSRIERNTGQWAVATTAVVDALDSRQLPPAPPAPGPATEVAPPPASYGLVNGARHRMGTR